MKSLAKNTFFNVIYTVIDFLSVIIRAAYVARILLADGVGRVSYVQSIAGYFLAFAQLGLPVYGVREIAKFRNEPDKANKIFTELFMIHFIFTTCALTAYFLFAPQIPGMRAQIPLFLTFGLHIFFNYFNMEWLYQGREEYVYLAVRNMAVKLLSFAAMFAFVREREDYVWYALICCMELGCNYAVSMIRLPKLVKPVRKDLAPGKHMKPLFILAIGTLFTALYSKVDITMLGAMSTKEETGYYTYANTAIFALTTACVAVLSIFFPRLSYYYKENQNKFRELLQLGIKVQLFISMPVSMGVFLLASRMVEILFGSAFLPAAGIVRILAVLIVVQSFANLVCYQVLIATGNEKEQIPAYLAAVFINILLNLFLIPIGAGNGAAAASIVSEIFLCIYRTCWAHRRISFSIPWKALGQAAIATAVMSIAVVRIIQMDLSPFVQCAAGVTGGAVVYGIVNICMRNELMMMVLGKAKTWLKSEKDGLRK